MNEPRALMPSAKIKYLVDAALGMARIHARGVIHSDLKPENMLIDDNDVLKIADFGISHFSAFAPLQKGQIHQFQWTPRYASPELHETRGIQTPFLTTATDVFSFGLIMWELLVGRKPFREMEQEDISRNVMAGKMPEIPDTVSGVPARMMQKCWAKEPKERPDFVLIAKLLQRIAQKWSDYSAPASLGASGSLVLMNELDTKQAE